MKRIFKAMFFVSWGTLSNETLVCVGVTKKEIRRFMVRKKVKPELLKKFDDKLGPVEGKTAFVWTLPGSGCTMLWMDSFVAEVEDMFTLVHETNHLIYDISRDKGFTQEPEMQAYQQEFLFKHIWTELCKQYKKFGVKSRTRGKRHEHSSSASQGRHADVRSVQPGSKAETGPQTTQNKKGSNPRPVSEETGWTGTR